MYEENGFYTLSPDELKEFMAQLAPLERAHATLAYDLYRSLADRFQTPTARTVFLSLDEQEKAHGLLFLDKLDVFLESDA
jgi:hypothetical protein